jgi:hypothetical protein
MLSYAKSKEPPLQLMGQSPLSLRRRNRRPYHLLEEGKAITTLFGSFTRVRAEGPRRLLI